MWPTILVLVILALLVGGALVAIYNRLVGLRNAVDEAWAGVDVELRRRHDLIPNLVNTVKGYAAHEAGTFEAVTAARAAAVAAGSVGGQAEAEQGLTRALRSLFAVAEAYPQLQADENFRQLQSELSNTEDRVSRARATYNGGVRAYETAREVFPANLIAGMLGFTERDYFEVTDPEARGPVTVEF